MYSLERFDVLKYNCIGTYITMLYTYTLLLRKAIESCSDPFYAIINEHQLFIILALISILSEDSILGGKREERSF